MGVEAPGGGDDSKGSATWFALSGLGMEFLAALAVPGGVGWWLDSRWHTSPWLLLIGIAVGFAVGLYIMIRASNRLIK